MSLVQAAQKVAGTNVTLVPINVPLTTTDWAPVAAQIKSLGANAVVTQLATANDVALVQALGAANVKIDYLQPSGSAADQTAQLAAKAGITYEVSSSWILDPSKSALRKQELADFTKYAPNIAANISDATNNAWFFPQIIKLAASKGLKDFTADRHRRLGFFPDGLHDRLPCADQLEGRRAAEGLSAIHDALRDACRI